MQNMNLRDRLMQADMENPDTPASPSAPCVDWRDMGESEHFVQFYEDDAFLVGAVSGFIGAGLDAGSHAVVIATQVHRDAIDRRLRACGLDSAALQAHGRYRVLDAQETLAQFMRDGAPDEERFHACLGTLLASAARDQRGVRVFGEMVALLWAQGNPEAAIRLETLWNDLGRVHAFSLFCAYPMRDFRGEAHGKPLMHICQAHSRVIPAESYATASDADARLRSVALLQQKAVSLAAEVAERQHAESTAREQQSKLGMAVALAGLGIWEWDLDNDVLSCSAQCRAHLGLAPNAALSYAHFLECIHADDREAVQGALRTAIAAQSDCHIEFRVIGAGGHPRWIAAMGRCFRNGGYRMLGATLDVTERKQDAMLLERTVAERTARLQESIGELEALSYSISHDLRAPLRAMQGYAGILLEDCGARLDAEHHTYLQRIASAAGRMDLLIQDALALSRLVRMEPKAETVNLDRFVRDLLDTYPNLQPPHAHIVVDGPLPPVVGNEAALTQCLSNLLGNAVKFVAPGTPAEVHVWAERMADTCPGDQASMVRIFIRDNGIGISKETHEKIFSMFHRLNPDYEGTGMGLAIVKKAAERMGGRVGVESEPGRGSTFWLELRHASPPPPRIAGARTRPKSHELGALRGRRGE